MMLACGAIAPDCSTSRVVSSEPEALLTGPDPPSTLSSVIRFALVVMCRMLFQKYSGVAGSRLASVMIPIVRPRPVAPSLYSGLRLYCLAKSAGVRLPVWVALGLTPGARADSCAAVLMKVG